MLCERRPEIDAAILERLQRIARASIGSMAKSVGLSPSACPLAYSSFGAEGLYPQCCQDARSWLGASVFVEVSLEKKGVRTQQKLGCAISKCSRSLSAIWWRVIPIIDRTEQLQKREFMPSLIRCNRRIGTTASKTVVANSKIYCRLFDNLILRSSFACQQLRLSLLDAIDDV